MYLKILFLYEIAAIVRLDNETEASNLTRAPISYVSTIER